MKLQVLTNEDYQPTYNDRRRSHLARFTDAELRQKIERMTDISTNYSKNRAKLSDSMRKKLDVRLKTVTAEDLECYTTLWNIAMSLTRQIRLQNAIISLLVTEQRIRRISDELRERLLERPRFRLIANEDSTESAGIRQLRANMRAFDRRNKGDK
jgi:deoxyadenosine/deoxycytidine kinase